MTDETIPGSAVSPALSARPGRFTEPLFRVIFGHQTPAGRRFDVILASVLAVMLDSVEALHGSFGRMFLVLEWIFTLAFTIEYLVRLAVVREPGRYARSFFGIVDLLSILPTYLSLILPGANTLLVIRILRILRIFRILKLVRYLGEANLLVRALMSSRRKIFVFIFSILALVVIFGSIMYLIEGPAAGFTSIPRSMYWAIVTLTTVGYGDISPTTPLGQMIAALIMIMGYGIIAVPTGIYTAELSQTLRREYDQRRCPQCGLAGHDSDASFCSGCGVRLDGDVED